MQLHHCFVCTYLYYDHLCPIFPIFPFFSVATCLCDPNKCANCIVKTPLVMAVYILSIFYLCELSIKFPFVECLFNIVSLMPLILECCNETLKLFQLVKFKSTTYNGVHSQSNMYLGAMYIYTISPRVCTYLHESFDSQVSDCNARLPCAC